MTPEKNKTAIKPTASSQTTQAGDTAKKDLNLDLKSLTPKLRKLKQRLSAHFSFIVIIVVLLVYLFVVWNIRALITAEPTIEAENEALAGTSVPKIDQKAISEIQSLESNSPTIRSLFDKARNNPFHE